MEFEVRKITATDIADYRSALDSVVSEKKYLLTVQTPTLEDTDRFIRRNIKNNYAQYVALVEDKIVGWADIIPHEKELIKHVGLLGIGVISEYRGKGIGKELLIHTINHARETGLQRLELEVFANNVAAIELYKQLGFEQEGIKRNARYINDRYEDVCIMSICYV